MSDRTKAEIWSDWRCKKAETKLKQEPVADGTSQEVGFREELNNLELDLALGESAVCEHHWNDCAPVGNKGVTREYCGLCTMTRSKPVADGGGTMGCKYCGGLPDHKCGQFHACGDCCGNHGELMSKDKRLYEWVKQTANAHGASQEALRAARERNRGGLDAVLEDNGKLRERMQQAVEKLRKFDGKDYGPIGLRASIDAAINLLSPEGSSR